MFAYKGVLFVTILVITFRESFGAVVLGGCKGTQYGCCADGKTPAGGPNKPNCLKIGGCKGTRYGCCPDGVTSASGENGLGCPPLVGGCKGTRYGCCEDGITSASGQNGLGCGEINVS